MLTLITVILIFDSLGIISVNVLNHYLGEPSTYRVTPYLKVFSKAMMLQLTLSQLVSINNQNPDVQLSVGGGITLFVLLRYLLRYLKVSSAWQSDFNSFVNEDPTETELPSKRLEGKEFKNKISRQIRTPTSEKRHGRKKRDIQIQLEESQSSKSTPKANIDSIFNRIQSSQIEDRKTPNSQRQHQFGLFTSQKSFDMERDLGFLVRQKTGEINFGAVSVSPSYQFRSYKSSKKLSDIYPSEGRRMTQFQQQIPTTITEESVTSKDLQSQIKQSEIVKITEESSVIEEEDLEEALPNLILSQVMLGLWCYLVVSVTDVIWFYTVAFLQFWLNASSFKLTAILMVLFPGGSLMLQLLLPKNILFEMGIMGVTILISGDILSRESEMYDFNWIQKFESKGLVGLSKLCTCNTESFIELIFVNLTVREFKINLKMENIQVIVRVRPSNPAERDTNDLEIWQTSQDMITITSERYNDLVRLRKFLPSQRVEFGFNQCYDQRVSTTQIYSQQIKRITLSSLQGINGTVFMYGQTGSGKTFTMMGPHGVDVKMQYPPRPRTNPRNNSHRSPSHKTKDRTPQRQESGGTVIINHDVDTPDKLGIFKKNNSIPKEEFKQLQFDSEFDSRNQEGILVLALQDLFGEIERQTDNKFVIRCSYVEIYTDQVYDLLKPQDKLSEVLSINEDTQREFYIKGATEEIVTTIDEILEMIRRGETNRHYASTIMNHASSRSHTIFRLYVRCVPISLDGSFITESILNFVDLAGSEKINIHDSIMKKRGSSASNISVQTNPQTNFKDRQNESKHINKSLFYLTQVISLRSQGQKDQHIPYRNSPLTKILRSSLGGNSRTAIILCVNPCFSQFEQTLSTLRFGSNAKQIKNIVQKNIVSCENREEINKIIGDYEKKLIDMERFHQTNNQGLLKVIEILQSRANNCGDDRGGKMSLTAAAQHLQQILDESTRPRPRSDIHFPGVGVLQIGVNEVIQSTPRSLDSSFYEGANKRECNLNEQIRLYQQKISIFQHQMEEISNSKAELLSQVQKLERKYLRQKKKMESQVLQNQSLSLEVKKLQKICALYHQQLNITDLFMLDQTTQDLVKANLETLQETFLKVRLIREISTKHPDQSSIWQSSEALKISSNPLGLIKYPKIFLECPRDSDNNIYWDPIESHHIKAPSVHDDVAESFATMHYTTRPVDSGFESFQNYFSSTGHSIHDKPNELENIDHQLMMLQSDYNILRFSPTKNEAQISNQSIQNFKEPAIHHQKVQSAFTLQTYQASPRSRNPLTNKENTAMTVDFSKKTNSVPAVEDQNFFFSSYFDQRKQASQY